MVFGGVLRFGVTTILLTVGLNLTGFTAERLTLAETIISPTLYMNKSKGVTFLISTHDTRVMNKARRVILLGNGQITSDTPVGENLGQDITPS